jgi:hypothetical protein
VDECVKQDDSLQKKCLGYGIQFLGELLRRLKGPLFGRRESGSTLHNMASLRLANTPIP